MQGMTQFGIFSKSNSSPLAKKGVGASLLEGFVDFDP